MLVMAVSMECTVLSQTTCLIAADCELYAAAAAAPNFIVF